MPVEMSFDQLRAKIAEGYRFYPIETTKAPDSRLWNSRVLCLGTNWPTRTTKLTLVTDLPTQLHCIKLGGFMITYDLVALNREQRRLLVRAGTIESCRDRIHDDARRRALGTVVFATSYYGLVAMTPDPSNLLCPYVVHYIVEANHEG